MTYHVPKATVSAVAGTYTFTAGHGVSDPVPHNAGRDVIVAAMTQAEDRDRDIDDAHRADPVEFFNCKVCNPPLGTQEARVPRTFWQRLRIAFRTSWNQFVGSMSKDSEYFRDLDDY